MLKRIFLLFPLLALGHLLWAQTSFQKDLQTQFIMAAPGDTIRIPAGNFSSKAAISLDEKENIVIMGAGMDQTVISFKGQDEGAEGFRIANCADITIMDLTIEDASGDGIKAMDTEGIRFLGVKTSWSKKPSKKNGAYGFYPVSCTNVLLDSCVAIGASDAGIYVGQSHNIIVRRCIAYHNVAGIEIENSTMADVYQCEAYENTGGILVFDLPDLPKKKGGNVRVYENNIHDNNFKNFAPKANSVAFVPPGSGIVILSASHVEVYDNTIVNNITTGVAIASYYITERPLQDTAYYPYPTAISIHDNKFERPRVRPSLKSKLGILFYAKFKKDVPDILYDGILDEATLGEDGWFKDEFRICIRDNGTARFANIDAGHSFKNIQTDLAPYDCTRAPLKAPRLTMND